MTKEVFVIYGETETGGAGEFTEPLAVETTAAAAKSWIFDNPQDGAKLKIKPFAIGGKGTPRKPKAEAKATA